jgi:hypothetical protein
MYTRAQILLVVSLFSWIVLPTSVSADDVTLTGTISFNALDGSAEDHDEEDGVFTVDDGDLVIKGIVQCNDDPPLPGNAGACRIVIKVSGDLIVEEGGGIFAENRQGGGAGGHISLTVGGNLILRGPGALPGAVVSSSRLTGKDPAGNITLDVKGDVDLEAGSTIAASTPNGPSGTIEVKAGRAVSLAGLVASGPSRQVLGTKLTGKILNGGESKQTGGAILIRSGSGIRVEGSGIIVSQGESPGSQLVQLEACSIEIRGLVASVSKQNGPSQVVLRSGQSLLIDGRDLGSPEPTLGRLGRVRADGTEGGSAGYMVDLFANGDIEVLGPASSTLFAVSSSPGPVAQRSGGAITAISLAGALTASGNAFEAGKETTGNQGGLIDLKAKGNVTLDGATLRAVGDHLTNSSSRKGGSISVRSYQGSLSWTSGVGDVRPTGSGVVPPSRRGSITLTACSGIDTTGTQFPTVKDAVPPFPVENDGVCSPSAPSLPSGELPLPICNQPPVAVDDAYSVAEGGTLNEPAPGVLGNDTDPDADPLTAVLVSGPSQASSFTLNADGSFSYEHDGSETTSDTFTYKANDGSSDSNVATVTITITSVNDPPTLDPIADPAAINEDAGAQTVNLTGITSGDVETQPLEVTAVSDNPALIPNPTVTYTSPNATGSLQYTPVADASGTATITVTVTDGGPDGNLATPGDNATTSDTFVVTVNAVNDPPTLDPIADPAAINEDAGAQTVNLTGITAGDAETQPLQVTAVSDNLALIPNPTVIYTSPNATGSLQYTPVADASGTATIAVTVTDGGLDGNLATPGDNGTTSDTFLVTVNAVNDPPTLDPIADPAAINEDAPQQTVNLTGVTAGDAETQPLQVTAVSDNTALIPNPTVIYTSPNAAGSLQYTPVANAFGTANITVTVTDGGLDGNLATAGDNATTSDTFLVTVNAVNDPPVFNLIPDPAAINEDAPQQTVNVSGISAGPGEGTQPLQVTATSNNTGLIPNPTVLYTSPNATGSLQYTPVVNAFGTANITVTLTDGGADDNLATPGDNLSFTDVFVVVVNPVNDAPTVVNETFEVLGNTELRVDMPAGTPPHTTETTTGASSLKGVLDNDGDVEGDTITVTAIGNGCGDTSPPFDCTLSDGAVVHVEATGEFTYTPGPGDTVGSFTYTVTDQPAMGTPISVNGTVTFTFFNMIWYVKNDAPAGGNGTSSAPFNSITPANLSDNDGDGDLTDDLDSAGDYIFVFFGNGTTNNQAGGLVLENGQHLIGQHAGLSLNVNLNGNGAPTEVFAQPLPTACDGNPCRPMLDDTVVDAFEGVSARNVVPAEIVGMNLAGNVNAIDWTMTAAFSGTGTFTIRDNVVRSAVGDGVDMNLASTGAVNLAFHDNNLTSTGTALDIQETGTGSLTITRFHNNVVGGNTGGSGIVINNAVFDFTPGGGLDTVDGVAVVIGASGNGVGGAGMVLGNVQGDLHFSSNLNIFADGGAGLTVSGTGAGMQFRVNAGGAPTGVIEATGGPAVSATATGLDLRLTSLRSTNSASTGVSLTNVTGTFSAESGSTITNATGTDFAISGGTAGVTYKGTITDDVGQLVSVSGATAGVKSFEGAITDGDDGDGSGISLSGNTGATINFSGGLTLSTSGNPAFAATGGGTVNVTGSTNKLTTTTATALNVANTTIGSSDLMFRSISSNGGGNSGIVLNNTGALGGLTVTGTGGAGTGGTIQNKTENGISLINTRDVSLNSMVIDNNDGSGIFGDDVTNFSLIGSSVTNNGDTATGAESGLRFNELLGNSAITNSTISGSSEDNIRITPASGVLSNLAISGSTIGPNSATTGGNGVSIIATGTANVTVNVTGSTFQNNRASAFLTTFTDTSRQTINISTSTFRDNNTGVDLGADLSSDLTFNVSNNTAFLRHATHPIQVVTSTTSTNASQVVGTISGNSIGDGTADSGSRDSNGILMDLRGDVDAVIAVTNNTIRNTDVDGIFVQTRLDNDADAETGRLDLTLTGNVVNTPDDNSAFPFGTVHGMRVEARNTSTVCLDISGNTSSSVGGAEHFRVRQRDSSVFVLERLSDGDGTPNEVLNNVATVESFVAGQNAGGSTADATLVTGFTEAANGFCRMP